MCLIIYSPEGKLPPRHVFTNAHAENPDGIGIMDASGNVRRFLGKRARKRAWKFASELAESGTSFGVHFRWATHGAISTRNCHPFESASGALVMHNGVIGLTADVATLHDSDTAIFVREFMADAPTPGTDSAGEYYRDVGRAIAGGNKLLVLREGQFHIVNESSGHWHEGIWYSNTYSLPKGFGPKSDWGRYSSYWSGGDADYDDASDVGAASPRPNFSFRSGNLYTYKGAHFCLACHETPRHCACDAADSAWQNVTPTTGDIDDDDVRGLDGITCRFCGDPPGACLCDVPAWDI